MYSFILNCCAQMGRQLYSWHSRSSPITGIHGLSLHISLSLTHSHTHTHHTILLFKFLLTLDSAQTVSKSTATYLSSFPSRHQKTHHLTTNGLSCSPQPTPKRRLGISPRTPKWHCLTRYSRASVWGRQFGHHPRERFTRGVCGFEKVVVELC